jgi:hypothetical protein
MIRTEPVAAWPGVDVTASIADAAKTAHPNLIARMEPSIIISGPACAAVSCGR